MGNEGPSVPGTRPTCGTKSQDVSSSVLLILFSQTSKIARDIADGGLSISWSITWVKFS